MPRPGRTKEVALPCQLCGLHPPIQNSHVIPKFAYRRLKEGSPLNAFVHSGNVNRFVQDGWKGPYYCEACEKLFNGWETYFVNTVLDPFLRGRARAFAYDERLPLFSASVHFRFLDLMITSSPAAAKPADHTLRDALKQMCLTRTASHPAVFQYLQLLRPVTSIAVFPPGINTYLFEAVDASVQQDIGGTASSLSFVKLPGALLVTTGFDLGQAVAHPPAIDGHRLGPNGVFRVARQSGALLDEGREIVIPRVEAIQQNYTAMSARQMEKIQARIKADPDREVRRAHRSYLQDRYLLVLSRLRDWGVPRLLRPPLAVPLHLFGLMPPARRQPGATP